MVTKAQITVSVFISHLKLQRRGVLDLCLCMAFSGSGSLGGSACSGQPCGQNLRKLFFHSEERKTGYVPDLELYEHIDLGVRSKVVAQDRDEP